METYQATADTADQTAAASAEVGTNNKPTSQDFQARIDAAATPEELARVQREFFDSEQAEPAVEEAVVEQSDDTEDDGADKSRQDAEGSAEGEAVATEAEGTQDKETSDKEEAGASADKSASEEKSLAVDKSEGDASESEKGKQFRIRRKDPVEKRALELIHRNPDLSLEESLTRARKEILGDKAEVSSASSKPAESGLPQTVEEAQAKLKELRASKSKAMREELDLAKADELDLQMEGIRDHMMVLERNSIETQTRAKQQYLQEFNAAQDKATSLYEFFGDPQHAGFNRARDINEQLAESGDPLYDNPNKPLIIAQMVAAELRIAPKSAKPAAKSPVVTAASGSKPAAPAPVKKPGSVISSGGSRTVSTPSQSRAADGARIDAIQTLEELGRLGVKVD